MVLVSDIVNDTGMTQDHGHVIELDHSRQVGRLIVARGMQTRYVRHRALVRMTAYGTSRQFAATQHFGRFRSEADIAYRKRIYEYTPESIRLTRLRAVAI